MTATNQAAPAIRRVRAYFAPVERTSGQPTLFDPAQSVRFDLDAPPSPWIDLGWISNFERTSGTNVTKLSGGSPAMTQSQVRAEVEASVSFAFESWGKLQLSLASGTQQMNLLAVQGGSPFANSGGVAVAALPVLTGSTATTLVLGAMAAEIQVGSLVAVDVDLQAGATGFVGSGVSAAYVRAALNDVDYVRRVSLNVARVIAVSDGVLQLDQPLLAGAPGGGMKVSTVTGFCDREGSTFFQEWSALFVSEGQQGERVIWYYPRLQTAAGISEELGAGDGGYKILRLQGRFRALAVLDSLDGERVVCFRSYLPS